MQKAKIISRVNLIFPGASGVHMIFQKFQGSYQLCILVKFPNNSRFPDQLAIQSFILSLPSFEYKNLKDFAHTIKKTRSTSMTTTKLAKILKDKKWNS